MAYSHGAVVRRIPQSPVGANAEAAVPESGVGGGEFAPGSILGGKYRVERRLGEGGLGVVVEAMHLQLEQPVALKYLQPHAAGRPDLVERFVREARMAARIKSEHAVKVQDVDAAPSGVPYMVMEMLEGRDLEQIVAEAPLPVPTAIDYVLQVCEALAEAHAAGIVHRDLKPANLFLASRPGSPSVVKVLDFGISKDRTAEVRMTRVDERVGTPVFMSPEQLRASADVDARSDIWSLGVVLFELVTGKVPFDAPNLPELCTAILTQAPVPLSAVHADAPPELDEILARCLQKDRAERYQNVAELAQDLAQIENAEAPSRVMRIARVLTEAGEEVAPPTSFPSIDAPEHAAASPGLPPQPPASPPAPIPLSLFPAVADVVEDRVVGVFFDVAGARVDEMQFLSIDEAVDYASSLGPEVVRCDLYDEFADVRGRLRATYVRENGSGWVALPAP